MTPDQLLLTLGDVLVGHRNADGGWGYYPGKRSRVEPTCWAALALGAMPDGGETLNRACGLLRTWQRTDGLIAEPGLTPDITFNGLALVALETNQRQGNSSEDAVAARLAQALCSVKVLQTANDSIQRQNNQLRGWPWSEGAFSWVEPTAWCVLALKKWRRSHASRPRTLDARIAEADAMLLDRACRGGGWNYGNSNMLGRELHPYVPTTAEALLALQDRRQEAPVAAGLEFLVKNATRETSGMALSLAQLALSVYRVRIPGMAESLAAAWEHSRFLDNLSVTGMAAFALAADKQGADAIAI